MTLSLACSRRGHAPGLGRGLDQHDAGGGAAAADIVVALADALAAGGQEGAPGAVAGQRLAGRHIFGDDLRPVAVQFLGDHLAEAGARALAHLGAGHAQHDGVIRANDDPGVDLGGRGGRRLLGHRAGRQVEADGEAGGGLEDGAAGGRGGLDERHDVLPQPWRFAAACLMPARTRL